jgi:hypothetical protein
LAAQQRPTWLPVVIDRIHENWDRPPSAAVLWQGSPRPICAECSSG